jgi:uncharacterized repeat protein (TIGR03803 family)
MHRGLTSFLAALAGVALMAWPASAQPPKSPFRVLYDFAGTAGGASPFAGLIQDASGNFYGTTTAGGTNGSGTVFKLSADGSESALYSFTDGSDGGIPYANVIQDASGNLYGTTQSGGTVFKLTPDNVETVIHPFAGGADGANPYAGLVADGSGNLYGTTQAGGAQNAGTIFTAAPDGSAESVLFAFTGGIDGDQPFAGLFLGAKSELYGTTSGGGTNGLGTVFKVKDR